MPAGDAQRVWFPEMYDCLREIDFEWDDWNAASRFCREMTAFRSSIREGKGIVETKMACPQCGSTMSWFDGISIRSYLFAAHKIGLLTTAELNELDKRWAKYRRSKKLDKFAQPDSNKKTNTFDKNKCEHDH